jgi:predicted ATP-dependent endonuclease of OLD family
MRIEVRNLGVIKQAEIDLRPLTIFIGPNNAGKTWLAYTLAGILGRYGGRKYTRAYIVKDVQDRYPPLDAAIKQVLDEGNAKIDLVQFADQYGEIYINNVAQFAKHWMQEYLSTERASFKNLEVHVDMAETKAGFLDRILNQSWENKLGVGRSNRKPLLNVLKEPGKQELYMYTTSEESISEKLPLRAVEEFLVNIVFGALNQALYPRIFTFPTERTTFTPFLAVEALQQEQKVDSTIEPIRQFLGMIITLFQSSLSERAREAEDNTGIQNCMQLAQLLEKQILHGDLDFSTPEPDPRRKILFHPTERTSLEITIASSLVKELSSLVLYLRYMAKPGDWLIIDEPEMNLHPEAQARLTEFLAILVKAGLRILITTHSPFIVDHLNNLMKAFEHEDQESQETLRNEFFLEQTEAFIPKKDVSVYLVDNGTTENILAEDGLIHWDTFSDISDKVTQIYFKL